MINLYLQKTYDRLASKYPHEVEFLQAVELMFEAIEPVIEAHPEFETASLLEQMIEPERIISFRVPWVDDQGQVQVNTGYRVQFNSANGPYKGGLRFHPSVNQSILKFLAFEQVFKNILTGLPIGGGKGGADFDPKGKSDQEVMRFCQSFMTELSGYIGPDFDVPAGDIGVGAREIGYLYGQYKRLQGPQAGVLTGKPVSMGGSLGRTQATGFGLVYFLEHLLKLDGELLESKRVIISGSGNVAYHAALKVHQLGGRVVAMSDSDSAIYSDLGLNLDTVSDLKIDGRDRISKYVEEHKDAKNFEGSIWDLDIEADIALPCASQNEISDQQAKRLIKNGIKYLAEGANMPTSPEAVKILQEAGVGYAPGKAANAGGVAVSALEMSQNAMRLSWSFEEVDHHLHEIMANIFDQCLSASQEYCDHIDLAKGADIAAFLKLAELMQAQGLV